MSRYEGRLVLDNFSKLLYKLYNAQIFFCALRSSRKAFGGPQDPRKPGLRRVVPDWTNYGPQMGQNREGA
ncbi:BQ5605_C014g07460 [Microbotryum silenes-dioicae]|uniref:BQ5605_C014g07460 protein n=1 Tax=Microbotryum silenes-dioicae TaxID=796604 RepID=A0A2X0NX46_9BASI|nr:BQ5605_C014g07460 [Microbotryum silenes-dioicae]